MQNHILYLYTVNLIGDLLENYCWNDDLINISRLLFSLITLLTFPLECMVTKAVVDQTLRGGTDPIPMSKNRHAIITISILVATYFVSISTKCLGVALEINVSINYNIIFNVHFSY